MKLNVWMKALILCMAVCVAATTGVMAQDAKDAKKDEKSESAAREYTPATKPDDSYLAKFNAIDVCERLVRENLEEIYILKVISSNYKDQGWDKDYQGLYDGYKKGVGLFYKRDAINARVELEDNRKGIQALYKKISGYYKGQTEKLLSDCADAILNLSLDEKTKSDPNKNKVVFQNMMRLRIGYGQLDEAEANLIEGNFASSVYHYRVAKSYAIRIMEELDPEASKNKFDTDKADNLNRILNPESKETVKKETPK
ncbi:MAG: hypothetical protein EPN93_07025 [Spirochaetes bacterium]|nr:MAG: hypothetical protein EPN93_07025 [Spirochaetota bacterium]